MSGAEVKAEILDSQTLLPFPTVNDWKTGRTYVVATPGKEFTIALHIRLPRDNGAGGGNGGYRKLTTCLCGWMFTIPAYQSEYVQNVGSGWVQNDDGSWAAKKFVFGSSIDSSSSSSSSSSSLSAEEEKRLNEVLKNGCRHVFSG